jgi:hypothetical protein
MIQCKICKKEFKYKYLLTKHESRKKMCGKIDDLIQNYDEKITEITQNIDYKVNRTLENMNKHICLFCNRKFLNKTNIKRHLDHSCLIKKELSDNINILVEEKNKFIEQQRIQQHNNEMKELRSTIAKLLKKKTQHINITNNNKTINNNLVVNINSFGNESLSHITTSDYKKFLSGFFPGFIKFIEKIHFDDNAPENHNISITNLKSKYMYIYDNGKWAITERNELIDKFIARKYDMLAHKCDELEEKKEIDEKTLNKFMRFSQNYKDAEAQKNTKNNIMLMIYNNKNKINKIHMK